MPLPSPTTARRPWLQLLVAVCLVAMNLRMTITGVGPLLEQIAADQGVALASLGALASVPLLAWGLFSPLAHGLAARIGLANAVSCSLLILAAGTLWRSLPGAPANLWFGTALLGLGLAIGNVLMPAVIKRDFGERLPLVMGLYSALLGGFGAISAGAVVPISQLEIGGEPLGWRIALLATGVLLPVALLLWMRATRRGGPHGEPRRSATALGSTGPGTTTAPLGRTGSRVRTAAHRIWADPLAWLVSLYMGAQSIIFYMLSAWLAPYAVSLGRSPVAAGLDMMTFQLIGIAGSLLLPVIAHGRLRRWAPALLPALGLLAWVGFVAAPALLPAWLVIGGLVGGASLTMALTLMAVRARNAGTATALSGMAQSLGYLIAAIGPAAFGWVHGWSGEWVAPFALLWIAAGAQLLIGLAVGRERFVLERA